MRTFWLAVLFCLAAGSLLAEPIRHPMTGEEGFFVSVAEMRKTVVGMKERDLYKNLYEKEVLLHLQDQACFKTTKILAATEAGVILVEGLLLWLLK